MVSCPTFTPAGRCTSRLCIGQNSTPKIRWSPVKGIHSFNLSPGYSFLSAWGRSAHCIAGNFFSLWSGEWHTELMPWYTYDVGILSESDKERRLKQALSVPGMAAQCNFINKLLDMLEDIEAVPSVRFSFKHLCWASGLYLHTNA